MDQPNQPPQGGPPAPPCGAPPEPLGPAPGVRLASHGARLVASIVDGILVGVMVTVVAVALPFLTAGLVVSGAPVLAAVVGLLVIVAAFLVTLGYFPWFWAHGGATPGMRMFSLRLVRDRDGGPLGRGEAILRLVELWISGAVLYLGFVWILVDRRRRGWHDLIAGTVMVQPA
ncbi:MAG: RDD family protein [Chloroflexi bacterium]|nr:RDD family protein [Chloroflexota bacterium]